MCTHDTSRFDRLFAAIGLALAAASACPQAWGADAASGTPVEGRMEAPGWQGAIGWPAVAAPKDTPGLRYVTVSGSRFQPTASSLTFSALGGAVYATAIPAGGFSFSVDFELPAGAVIREVLFYVVDNDAGTDLALSLRSYDPVTDAFSVLASGSSSGANAGLQTVLLTVSPGVVFDATNAAYRLRVAPGVATSSHLLRGARIGYLPPVVFANGFETPSLPMSVDGKSTSAGVAVPGAARRG